MRTLDDIPGFSESVTAMDALMAHQQDIDATDAGRRSRALRDRAQALLAKGQTDRALDHFRSAHSLFTADDDSAAAAAASYDLAQAYKDRLVGPQEENLLAAERLYRRALASSARQEVTWKDAMTRHALASCLRTLAEHPLQRYRRSDLLMEARDLLRDAVRIGMGLGLAGRFDTAGCIGTLANLDAQEGDLDGAIRRYRDALKMAQEGAKLHPYPTQTPDTLRTMTRALASLHEQRGTKADQKRALRLLSTLFREGHALSRAGARLAAASLHVRAGRVAQAEHLLKQVELNALPPGALDEFVDVLTATGAEERALEVLDQQMHELIKQRVSAAADHRADQLAAQLQSAAATKARLLHERGDAVGAFVSLDVGGGLRFEEAWAWCTRVPASPVARALAQARDAFGEVTARLEDFASKTRWLGAEAPPNEVLERLRELEDEAADSPPQQRLALQLFQRAITEATDAPAPAEALERAAGHARSIAVAARRAASSMQPGPGTGVGIPLDADSLAAVCRRNADHVFVRVRVTDHFLAASVWWGDGRLEARSVRVAVPEGWPGIFDRLKYEPDAEQKDDLRDLLSGVDLSPLFPVSGPPCVVFLPSAMATFLPLGVIGPHGSTAIDHFDAITWLPNLAPFRASQAPSRPRSGVATLLPRGTEFGEYALEAALPGETRLDGAAASIAALQQAGAARDVIAVYTHGSHLGDDRQAPGVCLADGNLDLTLTTDTWVGLERLELWACESGRDLPSDWRVPLADEFFGQDGHMLNLGVRSAIGTLWTVPDLVTAIIVRRYREEVADGTRADIALTRAQRWWRDTGWQEIYDGLLQPGECPSEALRQLFGDSLGRANLGRVLGPVDGQGELERLRNLLTCPTAWAGYRFVGVCDRRPEGTWTEDHLRPLTPDEEAQVVRFLEAQTAPPAGDCFEHRLDEAIERAGAGAPSPVAALEVARLYRDRTASERRHNLLTALAWLHEALALPSLESHDEERLAAEAAGLWLEIAVGEWFTPTDVLLPNPSARVAASRAEALLTRLPRDRTSGARALTTALRAVAAETTDRNGAATRVASEFVEQWGGRGDDGKALDRAKVYDLLWGMTALVYARSHPAEVSAAALSVVAGLQVRLDAFDEDDALRARLGSVVLTLASAQEVQSPMPFYRAQQISAPQLAAEFIARSRLAEQSSEVDRAQQLDELSGYLTEIEAGVWGRRSDDAMPLWSRTGGLSAAYRTLLDGYLIPKAQPPGSEARASHVLACLNFLADLRVTTHHRWMTFARDPQADSVSQLAWLARSAGMALDYLGVAAVAPCSAPASPDDDVLRPALLDPWHLSTGTIRERFSQRDDLPAWNVVEACDRLELGDARRSQARTAAFDLVRGARSALNRAAAEWSRFLSGVAGATAEHAELEGVDFAGYVDPGRDLDLLTGALDCPPPGSALLGLHVTVDGRLLAAAVWNGKSGVQQRLTATDPGTGLELALDLLRLTGPSPPPDDAAPSRLPSRSDSWAAAVGRVEAIVAPILGAALEDDATDIGIFAPGALRGLPWVGFPVDGSPLFAAARSVALLPSLAWPSCPTPRDAPPGATACLLPRGALAERAPFGIATVQTLRAWWPPICTAEEEHPVDPSIPEADDLEAVDEGLDRIRCYSVGFDGALYDGLAGLDLTGERQLREQNLAGLTLGACREVEIWAATSCGADRDRILGRAPDRLPGLVHVLLQDGADGVLDLAWEIPDVVKALVCESYAIRRHCYAERGAVALTKALEMASFILQAVHARAGQYRTLRHVLQVLDAARAQAATIARVDPSKIVPFASTESAGAIGDVAVSSFVSTIADSSHLASFRWWGA